MVGAKPLKRLYSISRASTGLKPGANESTRFEWEISGQARLSGLDGQTRLHGSGNTQQAQGLEFSLETLVGCNHAEA